MPGEPPWMVELESLLAERGEWLLRTAILLAGSPEAGEDLLQAALERAFRNWRRIHGDTEGTCGARWFTWPRTGGGAIVLGAASWGCCERPPRVTCPTVTATATTE